MLYSQDFPGEVYSTIVFSSTSIYVYQLDFPESQIQNKYLSGLRIQDCKSTNVSRTEMRSDGQ